jgi:predicted methyltransferase
VVKSAAMTKRAALVLVLASSCSGSGAPSVKSAGSAGDAALAAQVVAAPDRTERDRKEDSYRKPTELLTFFGTQPGMHVADLGAGGGYATELEARAVGPTGVVFAQDTPNWAGEGLTRAWEHRLANPVMKNTTHVMQQWDDPLPPEAKDLDAVYIVAAYHDVIAEKSDPGKLNQAVFAALKPGGVYVVIDNSAKDGEGATQAESRHRVDEKLVTEQVSKAGFKVAGTGDFLRNPADTRDWNADPGADPRTHTQDLFALKFVKP